MGGGDGGDELGEVDNDGVFGTLRVMGGLRDDSFASSELAEVVEINALSFCALDGAVGESGGLRGG